MAIAFSATELYLLKAGIEDRIERIDKNLDDIRKMREALGSPPSEEENLVQIVRSVQVAMLRKVEQELDIPFWDVPQIPAAELLS